MCRYPDETMLREIQNVNGGYAKIHPLGHIHVFYVLHHAMSFHKRIKIAEQQRLNLTLDYRRLWKLVSATE